MNRMLVPFAILLLVFSVAAFIVAPPRVAPCAEEMPGEDLLDDTKADDKTSGLGLEDDKEMKEALKGALLFKLVKFNAPDEGIADSVYWRALPSPTHAATPAVPPAAQVAASTFPVKFTVNGKEVIKPEMIISENAVGTTYKYLPEGRGDLPAGQAVLQPGNIPAGGGSRHPAIQRKGTELRILCAPVRLEAFDPAGKPVAIPIKVGFGDEMLLREEAKFCPLIVWLPIGAKYRSSMGDFALTAEGKVQADALPEGVKLTAAGLMKTVTPDPAASRPGDAPPATAGAETVELDGFSYLVTFLVKPGDPVRVAFSRAAYEKAAEMPFDFESFTCTSSLSAPMGAATQDVSLQLLTVQDLPPDLAGRADGFVWFALWPPKGLLGSFQFTFSDKDRKLPRLTYTCAIADTSSGAQLMPHRMRTSWEQGEQATFYVLVPKGFPGGEAAIACVPVRAGAKPISLGSLALPAVNDRPFDSRGFTLATRALPPGDYRLETAVQGKPLATVAMKIVPPWIEHSPFFVHSMSGCYDTWPTDEAGLEFLRSSGMDMGTATGFDSMVTIAMPKVDAKVAARVAGLQPALPPEAATRPVHNDVILDRLLRHRIRMIDLAPVRALGFYMEGLSYHHSYKPSVDRTVRRFQIFAQQTLDYPSWWGINHSWFPAWGGYAEGGVPCDGHVGDRNRTLFENVKKAGIEEPSREDREWYEKNKFADDPATRDKAIAIMRKTVKWGRSLDDFAWGKHNKLYNDAVREVKPDAVFALYENAGHDCGKRTRALFNDMAAACYESYTDYGEWPMSAGFTTDWAKGNMPNRRVWLTVDWGGNYEARMKSLFHTFGRGATGAGTPLGAVEGLRNLARSGSGMKFLGEVGAIAARGKPDARFAILATGAHLAFHGGHRTYDYHAMYYHLTRLGCPPVVVPEEDLVGAPMPESVKALFIVREEDPIDPDAMKAIKAFQDKGGKVLMTEDCLCKVEGATVVPAKIKHIWEMSGFQGKVHGDMWRQFEDVWRKPLADALAKAGVQPLATTDSDWGVALGIEAEPVRYVVVIADKKNSHANDFEPVPDLPVAVLGTGWTIRDIAKQQTLQTTEKDGRTVANVNLITEPATIIACYKSAPKSVQVKAADVELGGEFALACDVLGENGQTLGPVPVGVTIIDPAGAERETIFAACGDQVRYPLALHDSAGKWTVKVREMLTGLTATAAISVAAATQPPAVPDLAAIGDVHVVNETHLRDFAGRGLEKWVIVEPGQEALLPVAEKLTKALVEAGSKARLWQTKPEQYAMFPMRWYPWPEDEAATKLIAEGKLIGYRGNMAPFIDRKKAVHVPERGGWADIDPPYMIGSDCIVFSGGALANSLRAVSPWMGTPTVPGKGQGRLVALFSPFLADRHAVAIVANDPEGLAKAADYLGQFFREQAPAAPKAIAQKQLKPLTGDTAPSPIRHSYLNHTPLRRVAGLRSTPAGKAVVYLRGKKDTIAFVDEAGKITATVAPEEAGQFGTKFDMIDNDGNLWHYATKATATNASWGFPTAHEVAMQRIRPDGTTDLGFRAYDGDTGDIAEPNVPLSFPVAPNGRTLFLSRKAGFFLGTVGEAAWTWHDDIPFVQRNFEIRTPRWPVGIIFSPDSRYVLYTMDTRPTGFGGMNSTAWHPCGSETVLLDLQTGARVFSLRGEDTRGSQYAVLSGFGAVAADAKTIAIADYNGVVYLLDKTGKVLTQSKTGDQSRERRTGPTGGVGVRISDDGSLAAFAFNNFLIIGREGKLRRIAVPGIVSCCVSPDASKIVVGLDEGKVKAFAPDGKVLWEFAAGGVSPIVSPAPNGQVLAAVSTGELILIGKDGKEVRRTNVIEVADKAKHPILPADAKQHPPVPQDYREPGTLEIAQKLLKAKELAAWKPAGDGTKAFGKTFYKMAAPIELASPGKAGGATTECFVHLVYRKPEGNPAVTIATEGTDGKEKFTLDLPTPEYRVVDIPIRGVSARATITAEAPIEVAACSLWSLAWFAADLAYVKPANEGAGAEGALVDEEEAKDIDNVMTLDEYGGTSGKLKDVKIWWPNTDIDKVTGVWLQSNCSPLDVVDSKRFNGGKLAPWAGPGAKGGNFAGAWFSLDFGKPVEFSLTATYDRAVKQSELTCNLALLNAFNEEDSPVITAAVGNDQFWRLFLLPKEVRVRTLGVLSYNGSICGLSEVEVYSQRGLSK